MAFIIELIEVGKLKPVIDRTYSLDETAEALRYGLWPRLFRKPIVDPMRAAVRSCPFFGEMTTPCREGTMKAIVYDKYGTSEVLDLREIEKPIVKDDEVLVRVQAAAIAIGDWLVMGGQPYLVRLMGYGLLKPKNHILGYEAAGSVETVGQNVTRFQPGDEVFGWCTGGFAEYVAVPAETLELKPSNLTFEQAAAVPVSAFTALRALRDRGEVQPGQTVLIIGASGGVGTFAVQIAKAFGAEVTGVCSTTNVDMVRSIGADHVIDYTKRRLHAEWAALRRHPRHRGKPLAVTSQACPDA